MIVKITTTEGGVVVDLVEESGDACTREQVERVLGRTFPVGVRPAYEPVDLRDPTAGVVQKMTAGENAEAGVVQRIKAAVARLTTMDDGNTVEYDAATGLRKARA